MRTYKYKRYYYNNLLREYYFVDSGFVTVGEDALGYTYEVPKAFYLHPCGDKIVFQRYGRGDK